MKYTKRSKEYQQECIRRNCINFRVFADGGVMITGIIFVIGICLGSRSRFVSEYLVLFLYMTMLYILARICEKKQPRYIVAILYGVLLPIFVVGILMGTVFDPKTPAITIMVLLCGLTFFILDNQIRLMLYLAGIAITFVVVSYFIKDSQVFVIDVINILIYSGIGLGINYVSLKGRIEGVETYLVMQESRKEQEQIITNLPTGIIVFQVKDKKYSITQLNPAICSIMNIDHDRAVKIQGEEILEYVCPDDYLIVKNAIDKLSVPNAELYFEFRAKNMIKNTYFWTAANGKSVGRPDGSTLVYIGYVDIDARREREEEYMRRIRALADMDDDNLVGKGQHDLTKNKVLFYVSKRDYSAEVKVDNSYDDAVSALANVTLSKEKYDEVIQKTGREELINAFANGKTDGVIEFQHIAPKGQIMWISFRYSLFEEPKTGDVMAFMYSYDITERVTERKIMKQLSSMEFDLFGLIDVQSGCFTMLNQLNSLDAHILNSEGEFNKTARKHILELPNEEEQNMMFKILTVEGMVSSLEEKDLGSVLYSAAGADGKVRRKRFRYIYLDDTKQTIMFFRNDITEMYEKEQEQLKKIEEALYAAKVASDAKTEFFSRMSHDMRTPMNGILGLAELSKDEENKTELKKNIEKIRESGQYLLCLINDTLDFQRIESGKLTLEMETVNAEKIIENIADMVRQTAEAKGIELVVKNENVKSEDYIRTDSLRLKQIFVNLLSNSVKFTPQGGIVEFTIKRTNCDVNVYDTVITVRDTGIGMSEEFLETKIFKPFSQESNAVTSQYAGSGLGLSIAKRLVEMMGGRIMVASELGNGTTFTIEISFEQAVKNNTQDLSESNTLSLQDYGELLHDKFILLVEDHPLNAEIAIKLLKKTGCSIEWKKNGREAVDCMMDMNNKHYDAVLMDIRMPVMDGLEATRRIRAINNQYTNEVPIIAMTANAYEEDIQHSLDAGMNAHLSKPIEPKKIYALLAQVTAKNPVY